jgi:O-antigen/teichoic acid export membrane protein
MNGLRPALLLATADRYFSLIASFISLAAVSRLLTPHEIGLAVIGMAICGFWFRLREFTTASFLILREDVTQEDIRAAFTVSILLSALLCAILFAAAGFLAHAYQQEELALLLRVLALACFVEVIPGPVLAMFQRELAFGKVALINMSNAAVGTAATIAFALLGQGYLSAAFGWLAGVTTSAVLAILLWRDFSVFRPIVRNWRGAISFGAYSGINLFLAGIYETLPCILIGKLISIGAAADYTRSLNIVQLPDKLFLAGVVAVALPAFVNHARQGNDMKRAYVHASIHITALQWPALILISILAYPAVSILLGAQWRNVVPLVQIMALGSVLSFSAALNYPVLVSLGCMREVLVRSFIVWPISALIVSAAASFGLTAAAFGYGIAIGFQSLISTYFIRRHIPLGWLEFARALRGSFIVTFWTAAGALSALGLYGFRFDLSIAQGVAVGFAGVGGWLLGLRLTQHPLLTEILAALRALRPLLAARCWPTQALKSAGRRIGS